MAADYFSMGPNHIYIQHWTNNAQTAVMGLGLATGGVRKRIEPIWEQVQNDSTGQMQVESTFQGVSCVVSFALNIFDDNVLERCKLPLPNFSLTPGLIPPGAIGSFLRKSKNYFRILLWRPYALAQGLPQWISFPMARLANMEELEGGQEKRVPMTWIVHTPIQYCAAGNGAFFAYDGTGWPGAIVCAQS